VTSLPLNKGITVQLDANGNGTVSLGPTVGPPRWLVTKVSVRTSRPGVPPIPRFQLYLNSQDQDGEQDSSYDGSFDDSDVNVTVFKGGSLIGVWTGGQAGDVATMSLYGQQVSG